MTNPFGSVQAGVVTPDADGSVRLPLHVLVQSAVVGTVDDEISDHADDLFATLDEEGEYAWREACLLLTQHVFSGGHYGTGEKAAKRYLDKQPAQLMKLPVLGTMHHLNAHYLKKGADSARGFISVQPGEILRGVTRQQFCVSVGASGYPREKVPALLDALCVDADGQRYM